MKIEFIFILILIKYITTEKYPIAVIHGIGDACSWSMPQKFVNYIKDKINVEVKCIEIGNGFISSWFMEFSKQAEEACEKIKKEELFKNKFNMVGISQGTLIARYIIEKCDMPGEVIKYVSFDGPQMGIGSLPKVTCPVICPLINSLVSKIIYEDYFQKNLGPVGFYRYRYAYDNYIKYSRFLADLNNEKEYKSELYKTRFMKLEKVLLIKNKEDSVITPRESSWFEFYDKKGDEIVPLEKSDIYVNDFIGLKYLNDNGKLLRVEFEGDHVEYKHSEIDQHIIPFLN